MRILKAESKEEKLFTKALNIWIFSFLCVLGVIFMVKAPIISTGLEASNQVMIIETLLIIIGIIFFLFSLLFAGRTWWMQKRLRQYRDVIKTQQVADSMETRILQDMQRLKRTQLDIRCHIHQQATPQQVQYRIRTYERG